MSNGRHLAGSGGPWLGPAAGYLHLEADAQEGVHGVPAQAAAVWKEVRVRRRCPPISPRLCGRRHACDAAYTHLGHLTRPSQRAFLVKI